MGKGESLLPASLNNHTLTVLLYRYNTLMPVYLHFCMSVCMNMWISNVTQLCQDYAVVGHLLVDIWTKPYHDFDVK